MSEPRQSTLLSIDITRAREAGERVDSLLKKLLPRIEGGGVGGCPILALGITKLEYVEDIAPIVEQVMPDDEEDEQGAGNL